MGNCLVSLGWGLLGGKGWGIYAQPVVGMVDGGSPADEYGLSSALVLSLYFPYPFCPCILHTHRTNSFPPIHPVPLRAPYSHNNDTCTHGLMLSAVVLYRTQWLVVDLSHKVFLTCLLGCLRAG